MSDFLLERYFARWEFAAAHNLCASDIEGMPMSELISLADDETAELWTNLTLGYTEAPGHPLLRAEIARLYTGITADDVYTFAGAEEAIFVAMHALVGPGDHVVALWPAYQALYEVARSAGADVTLLEIRESDRWRVDVEALAAALRPGRTKLVVVNWPHSPTGSLPDAATFEEVARRTADAGATLFVDEVYRLLEHEPSSRLTAGAEIPGGISLGVMSKPFGLAGLRVGWLASRNRDVLARCARVKDYTTICNAGPSEILALIGLRTRDALLKRALDLVVPNRDVFDAFLPEHGFSWVRPRAGSTGYARLPDSLPSAESFCDELVRSEGLLLLPSTVFQHGDRHVRVGLGRPGVHENLDRLARFLGSR